MRWFFVLPRLAAAAALAAVLMGIALDNVPGLTASVHIRMMLFVFVGPWLVAGLVARPGRLLGALQAAFVGSDAEGLTTARVLELLGGLTITAGAVGVFGTMHAFHDATGFMRRGEGATRADLPGVVAAVVMPPAFALIVRFFFYEPVVLLLRFRFAPEREGGMAESVKRGIREITIVVGVVVAIVVVVWLVFLRPVPLPGKPTWDIDMAAIGVDPDTGKGSPDSGPSRPGAPEPIWITLEGEGVREIECRVEGETLGDLPQGYAKIERIVRRLAKTDGPRPIDVGAASRVSLFHVVSVLDACIALRRSEAKGGAGLHIPEIRLLVPTKRPHTVAQRLRFVFEDSQLGKNRVQIELPAAREAESVRDYAADAPPIFVTCDLEYKISEIYVNRDLVGLDQLEAILSSRARAHRNKATGLSDMTAVLCSDKHAPVGKIYEILTILAAKNLRVSDVHIGVKIIEPDQLR